MRKQIHMNIFDMNTVGFLTHGLWAHPDNRRHRYTDLEHWIELARLAERGLFDAMFLADHLGIRDVYRGNGATALREAVDIPNNDPMLLIPAMAAATTHLAFALTVSATYEPPFTHARRMSTLDHLTKGRIGWNIVTSALPSEARNFGLDNMIAHDQRYDIAEEYMDVCYKLWEGSWENGAVIRDRGGRIYTDPSKVHAIKHESAHFKVYGPHLSEPSPQRTPVLYQAGSSGRGRQFAARHAEAVFISGNTVDEVRQLVAETRAAAAAYGRDPEHIKFFPGLHVIVGRTRQEAEAKRAEIQSYLSLEGMLAQYSAGTGFDLSSFDEDEELGGRRTEGGQTSARRVLGQRTVREIYEQAGKLGDRFLFFVCGTPQEVADKLQAWQEETDLDGFNLNQNVTPQTLKDFIDLVVPVLQERGLYRTAYEPGTYRERLFGRGQAFLPEGHPGSAYRHATVPAA
jgi:FMN-dependent oxidoreductase (nitrilotriacetate monooxygenase family)